MEFDDSTGLLLGRVDGEWGAYLPSLKAGDVTAGGVSLKNHKHGGVQTGSGSTSKPE